MENKKVVYKYTLEQGRGTVSLPKSAEVLSAGFDEGLRLPVIYALVNPREKVVERNYVVAATGEDLPDGLLKIYKFINTFYVSKTALGTLVFHVFVEK